MTHAHRPRFEVADVIRLFADAYLAKHRLPTEKRRLMQDIVDCRTAALGGHVEECDLCDFERKAYNSCRNRHCPKCQTLSKEKWIEARRRDLLPVSYFHQVFTMPHDLNPLTLANRKVVIDILFRSVSEILTAFGKDPAHRLSGQVGFTAVLHTWNQRLLDHFHLHCVIPAGALREDGTWARARYDNYLFPVQALSITFRGKFVAYLRQAFEQNKLTFPGTLRELSHPVPFEMLLDSLARKHWHVYSKPPFGGPEAVLSYLGRYTHRVAISNHRLVDVSLENGVAFKYVDRKDGGKEKIECVSGEEFIRRFLLHTIPSGFVRIRHYGFLASSAKKKKLPACRAALGARPPPPTASPRTPEEYLLKLTGIDILACPHCGKGRMHKTREIRKCAPTSFWQAEYRDSS